MPSFIIFILGLSVGSFLNVVIDRLPRGKSIISDRSYCDFCRRKILWYDLIPVFSFIILGRRCRFCHDRISFQYPLVELLTGFFFVFVFNFLTTNYQLLTTNYLISLIYHLILVSGLIAIFFTDLKYRIIPDQILALMSISTLVFLFAFNQSQFLDHLLAGLILFIVFISLVLVTKGRGMGLGDVKYAAVSGFILGIPYSIVSFYLSFLTGAVFSMILIVAGKKSMKDTIPFGPFLVMGTFASLFFGKKLWPLFTKIIGL